MTPRRYLATAPTKVLIARVICVLFLGVAGVFLAVTLVRAFFALQDITSNEAKQAASSLIVTGILVALIFWAGKNARWG